MGIFDKFKKGFQKSASAFSSGLKEIIIKKEIDDENLDKIEEFLLSNENSLRKALNLPTYESYKDFVEREDDPEILDVDEEVLGEAANILIDLIELKEKPLLALNEK